jgi:TPR repeat protein
MSEQSSALAEFSRSIWAKVLGVLTITMMLLGIYVEIITAWRSTNEAIKAAADAAVAKQLAGAQTEKLSEEARVAKELNDAQTQKLKAEANVAKDINQAQLRRAKAEECSARMKAILDTQPLARALSAGDALQQECSDYIIQTPARPLDDAQVKMVDLLHFYRWLASNCHWTTPPNFDVADRFMADNSPAEYAAGRAAAQQSITQYTTVTKDLNSQMACVVIRSRFDEFTQKLDTLLPQRLGGDTADPARLSRQQPPTRSVAVTPDSLPTGNQVLDPDIEAVRRYKLAADHGDADGQFNLGKMYEAGRGGLPSDSMEAARLFKFSADQGHAGGQLHLAYMYETGSGVLKDLREAARLYRLSADQGNAEAQANLADFYERGDAGLRKDACQAIRLRQLAAAQGNTYAQRSLVGANTARCKL